jgi:hypothetical protein
MLTGLRSWGSLVVNVATGAACSGMDTTDTLSLAALMFPAATTTTTQAIEALATGQAHAAGRRLMQAVTSTPAAGGATTSTVTRPPITTGGDLWCVSTCDLADTQQQQHK